MSNQAAWKKRAKAVNARFTKLGQAKGRFKSHNEMLRFLSLAICGEAGELANLVKKQWRGDDVDTRAIADEMADIAIYLNHLAEHIDVDLDVACERKIIEVEERLDRKENRLTEAGK